MSLLRPLFLLLLFFGALFLLREPLHNFNGNAHIVKQAYVDPFISFVKGMATSSGGSHASSSRPSIFNPFSDSLAINWIPGFNDGSSSSPASTTGSATIDGKGTDGKTATDPQKPKPTTGTTGTNKDIITASNGTITADNSSLSLSGILTATNKERTSRQFPALRNSRALNSSAEKKLQDMFSNQYFEHESPKGVSVSDLVRNESYEYIVVGENLALGNFGGDVQVVTAWMNSPGHRANILDPRFQEIGIAVGRGIYKGKEQWIAVQHFAKPLSSCPGPNSELKSKINTHTTDLSAREKALTALKAEIDATTNRDEAYNAKVTQYNNLVGEYNTYLESLKDEINRYNEQVRAFNSCAGLVAKKSSNTAAVSGATN